MKRSLSSFLPALLLLVPLAAQDEMAPPKPAAELAKLKAFAGHWRGEGTAIMQPGAPATKWTGQVSSEWVLGGHWLQSDTSVQFEGMPTPMRMREYMGWDAENQRYVNLAVNNAGEGMLLPVHFVGADTMVLSIPRVREGQPEVERATSRFGADQWSFQITFLAADGPARDAVDGKFRRVDKAQHEALGAAHAMAPAHPEMAKLVRMAGEYDVQGEMVMMPGTPAMKIKGRDSMRALFDGAILAIVTKGTAEGSPEPYESHGYCAWNPVDRCYETLSVDNMGMVGSMQQRLAGNQLIGTFAGLRMGMPCTSRMVLELDADGRPQAITMHSCMGAAEPMCDFRGTYKPAK